MSIGGTAIPGPVTPGRASLPRLLRPVAEFLRRHPVVALLLLTPGIPEYLSSSSSLNLLFVNPFVFALFFGANVGIYLPGALLIREARVRWRKGWGTVLCLGAAYAIAEEGVGLSTMFNPHASAVGDLGFYGHWLGVNWVWLPGVMMFHIVFSISIPLLLFGYAFPDLRDRPLLSARGVWIAFGFLALDLAALQLLVRFGLHYFMGPYILAGALAAIGALTWIAWRLPSDLFPRGTTGPSPRPRRLAALGALLFPGTVILPAIAIYYRAPPILAIALLIALFTAMFWLALRWSGSEAPDRPRLAFIAGALVPVAVFGLVGSFPSTVAADLALGYFLLRLWRAPPAPPRPLPSVGNRPVVPGLGSPPV